MGIFGSSKKLETFEELLKEELNVKYKFKREHQPIGLIVP